MPRLRLYAPATQTVFGEGPKKARAMLVGETPGDREDREGHPFVGPAGRELDKALEKAGIERADVYLTNAVKHFKFEERGKRRIHQTPKKSEVDACLPWLREELKVVKPEVLVILGATAGKALMGPRVPHHAGAGRAARVGPRAGGDRHGAPERDPARPRRRGADRRARGVHERLEGGGRDVGVRRPPPSVLGVAC